MWMSQLFLDSKRLFLSSSPLRQRMPSIKFDPFICRWIELNKIRSELHVKKMICFCSLSFDILQYDNFFAPIPVFVNHKKLETPQQRTPLLCFPISAHKQCLSNFPQESHIERENRLFLFLWLLKSSSSRSIYTFPYLASSNSRYCPQCYLSSRQQELHCMTTAKTKLSQSRCTSLW